MVIRLDQTKPTQAQRTTTTDTHERKHDYESPIPSLDAPEKTKTE